MLNGANSYGKSKHDWPNLYGGNKHDWPKLNIKICKRLKLFSEPVHTLRVSTGPVYFPRICNGSVHFLRISTGPVHFLRIGPCGFSCWNELVGYCAQLITAFVQFTVFVEWQSFSLEVIVSCYMYCILLHKCVKIKAICILSLYCSISLDVYSHAGSIFFFVISLCFFKPIF